ncbi:MAG: hypothetical protein OEY28_14255 [Nitrospira sp.]|nr:hypothetical protein [Nitrospira sp.]
MANDREQADKLAEYQSKNARYYKRLSEAWLLPGVDAVSMAPTRRKSQ